MVLRADRLSLAYFSGRPVEESVSDSASSCSSGSGGDRPAKNTLSAPSGANFEIAPLKLSTTNKLPELSKAKPRGDVATLAKSLLAPAGVTLNIVFPVSPT